jgi:hypothetical protein
MPPFSHLCTTCRLLSHRLNLRSLSFSSVSHCTRSIFHLVGRRVFCELHLAECAEREADLCSNRLSLLQNYTEETSIGAKYTASDWEETRILHVRPMCCLTNLLHRLEPHMPCRVVAPLGHRRARKRMQNARDPGERPQPSEAAWDIVDMLRETRTDVSNAVGVEGPSAGLQMRPYV